MLPPARRQCHGVLRVRRRNRSSVVQAVRITGFGRLGAVQQQLSKPVAVHLRLVDQRETPIEAGLEVLGDVKVASVEEPDVRAVLLAGAGGDPLNEPVGFGFAARNR